MKISVHVKGKNIPYHLFRFLLQMILFGYENSFTSLCVSLCSICWSCQCAHICPLFDANTAHGTQKGNGYSAVRDGSRPDLGRTHRYANSSSASSTSSLESELDSLLTPTDNSVVSPAAHKWLVCYHSSMSISNSHRTWFWNICVLFPLLLFSILI